MTPRAEEFVIEAAMMLREQSPDAWQHFVDSVRSYSAIGAGLLVRSPPDQLVINQGKALAISDFALLLQDVPKRFDAMRQRRNQP